MEKFERTPGDKATSEVLNCSLTGVRSDVADFLSPDGYVIISLPNIRHYSTLTELIFKGVWSYRDRGIHDRTHLKFCARRALRYHPCTFWSERTSGGQTPTGTHAILMQSEPSGFKFGLLLTSFGYFILVCISVNTYMKRKKVKL